VVKAANTLSAEVLSADPHEAGGQRVIFISGDDADAKAEVLALFQDAGFAAIDLGDLATGGAMQQDPPPARRRQPDPTLRSFHPSVPTGATRMERLWSRADASGGNGCQLSPG
jgi:predicted dinucleotide-binding enzyme